MSKLSPQALSAQEFRTLQRKLNAALRQLQESGEIIPFLMHALTESECVMLARRIEIAKQLIRGKPQQGIAHDLHVGLSTVQSVDRWLGAWRGYRSQLSALYGTAREQRGKGKQWEIPGTFRALRRRYPLHFLLFNLLLDER